MQPLESGKPLVAGAAANIGSGKPLSMLIGNNAKINDSNIWINKCATE